MKSEVVLHSVVRGLTRIAYGPSWSVSQTVRDLVAGSGLVFEYRGAHVLEGVPDEWRLYRVET